MARVKRCKGSFVCRMRKAGLIAAIALCVVLSGCGTIRQLKEGIEQPVLTADDADKKAGLYHEIALKQRSRAEAYIQIVGGDIELPPTPSETKPSDYRTYTFDVWVNNGLVTNPRQAIRDGSLVIDVTGAEATFHVVEYGQGLATEQERLDAGITGASLQTESSNVVRIAVSSKSLNQSFTIIAKLTEPAEQFEARRRVGVNQALEAFDRAVRLCTGACRKNERDPGNLSVAEHGEKAERLLFEQNPYMAVRTIRVFNGDLHTQVYMLSDTEVRDAFGSSFARAFFVGRAYFRNRHTNRKLIVHTTSLRARTLFYREPEREGWFDRASEADTDLRYGYLERLDDFDAPAPRLTAAQRWQLRDT